MFFSGRYARTPTTSVGPLRGMNQAAAPGRVLVDQPASLRCSYAQRATSHSLSLVIQKSESPPPTCARDPSKVLRAIPILPFSRSSNSPDVTSASLIRSPNAEIFRAISYRIVVSCSCFRRSCSRRRMRVVRIPVMSAVMKSDKHIATSSGSLMLKLKRGGIKKKFHAMADRSEAKIVGPIDMNSPAVKTAIRNTKPTARYPITGSTNVPSRPAATINHRTSQ